MYKIKKIFNSEGTKYVIFGALTTFVNISSYFVLKHIGIYYVISNVIAFALSIIFAFITNKLYVFNSKTWDINVAMREFVAFLGARLISFFIDTTLLVLLKEILLMNDIIAKLIVNVVVIVINYVFSKFIVFKKISK